MSVIIDYERCKGCSDFDCSKNDPPCVKYCPGDLLAVDKESGKPYLRNERDCWDCMVCVKSCPLGAVETKLSYQLAEYRASLKPVVKEDKIIWYLKDRRGQEEVFEVERKKVNSAGRNS